METKKEKKTTIGTLYVVSTPIGNDDDLSARAINTLRFSDLIICEEAKIGTRLLYKLKIQKNFELLNEQNELEVTGDLIQKLLAGTNMALISDCGTPVFADPGSNLIKEAIEWSIPIVVVPGASSIMTALVLCGFSIDKFTYGGFLSRSHSERLNELRELSKETRTVVLLETPYRLQPILEAAAEIMPNRRAYIGCNLTMAFETHHRGTLSELNEKFKNLHFKSEFVLVFEGNISDSDSFKKPVSNRYDHKIFRSRTNNKPAYSHSESKSDKFKTKSDRPRYSASKSKFQSEEPKYSSTKSKYQSDKPKTKSERPRYTSDKTDFDKSKIKSDKPKYSSEKTDFDKSKIKSVRPKYSSEKTDFDKSKIKSDKPRLNYSKPKIQSDETKFNSTKSKFQSEKTYIDKKPKISSSKSDFSKENKFEAKNTKFDKNKKSETSNSKFKNTKSGAVGKSQPNKSIRRSK